MSSLFDQELASRWVGPGISIKKSRAYREALALLDG